MKQFSYKNEADKTYGATGMAMAIVIFDGHDALASINLDAEAQEVVKLTDEFYFSGNPSVSAKSVWQTILNNFNLAMAMSIANVLCRRVVLDHSSDYEDDARRLRKLMVDAGKEHCSLDDDETLHLFNKNFAYLERLFNHYGVQSVARRFADTLEHRRTMSRLEVFEALSEISHL